MENINIPTTDLSALTRPSRETVLEMVNALNVYCEKGGYHSFSFSQLQLEAMGAYRQRIRRVIPSAEEGGFDLDTTTLYRMAMTWGQVHNAMVRRPNEILYQVIWEVIFGVYQSHPTLTAELQSELRQAEEACRAHDVCEQGLRTAVTGMIAQCHGLTDRLMKL